ncbi:MAG: twin-arginine translocase subunit TatC [Saprospiraceae bacterium]|nr:twin-arginine translocase subunit TatC [Saprospiraceae bacterium]
MPLDQVDADNMGSDGSGREMSFLDHLEELRWHIIRGLLAVVVGGIVLFIFQDWLFNSVIFGPKNENFISYRVFCWISQELRLGEAMCMRPPKFTVQTVGVGEPFITAIKVSMIGGVVIGFPFIFWEIWKFIRPGLYPKERNATNGAVFVCSILFIVGVLFGYFIVSPFGLRFLVGYSIPGVSNNPTLSSMINYMIMFTLPSGLIFELPVVVYVLSRIGLVTPADMRKYRRHAIVAILIIAGVLTPPDAVTQFLVGIPLLVLYEVSILISARVAKQLAKKEKEESLT